SAPAQIAQTEPAQTTIAATAADATATPSADAQSEAASAERTAKGAIVTIPHASGHAVAAFLRGMTAWMVIDAAIPIDPAKLKASLGDLPETVDVASGN